MYIKVVLLEKIFTNFTEYSCFFVPISTLAYVYRDFAHIEDNHDNCVFNFSFLIRCNWHKCIYAVISLLMVLLQTDIHPCFLSERILLPCS